MDTLIKIVEQGVKLTPMMKQYYEIKKNYPETILLFRMGDFYEVFFEDAIKTAKLLNIARTHRGKLGETPIPMAGIPHHAASSYIDRLTSQGEKVAICEQVQDPKEAKGIVERAVTQIVSPGIPYDLEKANSDHRFISAACKEEDQLFLIALDFTTGDFIAYPCLHEQDLAEKIALLEPKEFITFMEQFDEDSPVKLVLGQKEILSTYLSHEFFNLKASEIYLRKLIPNFKRDQFLKTKKALLGSLGAVGYYLSHTQQEEQNYTHLKPFRLMAEESQMKVSLATLLGIEILPKARDRYRDSLLGFFDRTKTSMGGRMIQSLFRSPSRDLDQIKKRQQTISSMIERSEDLEDLRERLSDVRDLERILAKVSTGKANGSDLICLRDAFDAYTEISTSWEKVMAPLSKGIKGKEKEQLDSVIDEIKKGINDEIGATLEKGNLIKSGYHKGRDRLAKLAYHAESELVKLEESYREETGIQKLRVKSNNVAGFFIEVSKSFSDKLPKRFERRQTLTNSERFMTEELADFEKDILSSKLKLETLERDLFKKIVAKVLDAHEAVKSLSCYLATVDTFQSLAHVAIQEELSAPEFNEERELHLEGAWHPLIKSQLGDRFISHDLALNRDCYFGLITGPNMAGKTTVMREVALCQHLAQIGSFVPAKKANLPLCDFLFSRLGASDDILRGQSTFMVEMSETAEILRHATENSLIILDEVGRGTSTYDGLSIAWALSEHLINETKAFTLFATHYHELIEVIDQLDHAKNMTVETSHYKGKVQFLYRLIEKPASQSYGIYVAECAGLPGTLLKRSEQILKKLEHEGQEKGHSEASSGTQLSIFEEENHISIPPYLEHLETEIAGLDVMRTTPLDALKILQELKNQIPTESRLQ